MLCHLYHLSILESQRVRPCPDIRIMHLISYQAGFPDILDSHSVNTMDRHILACGALFPEFLAYTGLAQLTEILTVLCGVRRQA